MSRVIFFAFLGRHENMDISMPLIRHVLAQHPDVEFHGWNFARNPYDNNYLREIQGDRIVMNHSHYNKRRGWIGMHVPFHEYSDPSYQDCVFVKIDDDVVFFETERFGDFVNAIRENPGAVLSAQVVNNGASTRTHPGLWATYESLHDPVIGAASPRMPLLDVHLSSKYADAMHRYFFDHYDEMLGQPIELVDTKDWCSINLIGFDHEACIQMSSGLGKPSPSHIAGRDWNRKTVLGDEGAANMLPRKIMRGFIAAHLTFGPQKPTQSRLDYWRTNYQAISRKYLGDKDYSVLLPVYPHPVSDLATVCIPWRPAPERIAAHDRCVKFWTDNGYRVVEADSRENAGFLCTQARNNAVAMATTPIVIVADADTIPADIDQINDAVWMVYSESVDIVWPFTEYRHIPNDWVEKDDLEHAPVQRYYNNGAGGILVAKARTLWDLGGFDERFTPGLSANGSCHGYDDTAFYAVASTLCQIARVDGVVYSFNHATNADGQPARDFGNANPNKALYRQFRFARGKPDLMRKLITPLNV